MKKLDPWGSGLIESYEKLMKEFGIRPMAELLDGIDDAHRYMRRGIIYGHRDFDRVVDAMKKGKRYAMITGFMPSGKPHLGHKMVMDQIIWHQKKKALVYVCVADIEAYTVRRLNREKTKEYGMEYLLNLIALGLKRKNTTIYFQSEKDGAYHSLSKFAARKTTFNEMEAIYGELNPGKIISALTQVADILLPQLEHGAMPTVVPVGSDQDPHIRLTRDIASRFKNERRFVLPSATYHKFQRGLDGGKMSSSKPSSYIALDDSPETVRKKVMNALTGGRENIEEQRKMGGVPEACSVFELFAFHAEEDDKKLRRIYDECRSGLRLCGPCKKECADKLVKLIEKLNERREKAKSIVDSYLVK